MAGSSMASTTLLSLAAGLTNLGQRHRYSQPGVMGKGTPCPPCPNTHPAVPLG